MVAAEGSGETVVGGQSVRWDDGVGGPEVAGAHLAERLSVLGDRRGTATLLGTAASTTGWDVDGAVDAAVDRAPPVAYSVAPHAATPWRSDPGPLWWG